ncbi:MAG: ABC transporter permease [Proteobacteria bacterium]|nr:ABC transporter permease [Pseudomonadota bacterium]
MRDLHQVKNWIDLITVLVQKELKVRYKSSMLGYFWALANPFAFALVYWVAFKLVMRVQMENYTMYLLTGLFPWLWLSIGINRATQSYIDNAMLIKKIAITRAIIPLTNVVQEMVHFIFALPVFIVFLIVADNMSIHISWVWQIPLMVILQFFFVYPMALVFALTNVYVRDISYVVGIGFSLLFFITPMVYPITMVPEAYRFYFELNPIHALMSCWRGVFLEGSLPIQNLLYCVVFCAITGFISIATYQKIKFRIGELL